MTPSRPRPGLDRSTVDFDRTPRSFAGTRVLDVGAGTGTYVGVVPDPAEYVAVDLDPDKLARLEAKWPHVTTIVGDATRLDLPERSFDHALCTFLVHHLDDEGVAGLTAGLRRRGSERPFF